MSKNNKKDFMVNKNQSENSSSESGVDKSKSNPGRSGQRYSGSVRIAGVVLRTNKRFVITLRDIYGIGPKRAVDICDVFNIDHKTRTYELTGDQVSSINQYIEKNYVIEGDLRSQEHRNIKELMDLGTYRGRRHAAGLPCRGQRTHTNARTRKNKKRGKRIPIAGKKKTS